MLIEICELLPEHNTLTADLLGLHGLNLQAGGHLLVWFSLTWSLELYQQLNGRLHRQGQKHPVTITHLTTAGTIDGRVLASLDKKDTTQEALIDAVKAELFN